MSAATVRAGWALSGVGLRHTFRSGFTLDVPRIDVPAGCTLALLGPSGSGKSTLLAVLGLLQVPAEGRVLLDGREVSATDREARLATAAVFQRPYLMKGTVAKNVEYGLALRRVARAERRARAERALERVGLAGFADRSAGALSGGEAQRVALARALVLEPRVLLLDEPLASLDPLLSRRLVTEFGTILREEGVTVVWVTHDHDEASAVADLIAVMRDGRIVETGPARSVLAAPADAWVADFVGSAPPVRGRIESVADGLATIRVGPACVYATVEDVAAGQDVSWGVRPEDVLLFEAGAELPRSSARNQVTATVTSTATHGAAVRIELEADGFALAASVSHRSAASMGLRAGDRVNAVFKATAVHVVPETRPQASSSGPKHSS